ncbi:MAG TPA: PKD domain-containing protein, partial [Bacteroidia bacterium]
VQFDIFDSHGVSIPCSHQRYTGSPGDPSYYTVSGNGCASNFTPDHYKPWTLVGINLSAYIGQTLNVVITNADCDQGGHFAYSYWDFLCGSSSLTAGCTGIQTSICGPVDPNIAYTYQWYHNGTAIPAPQGTQQCITVTAQPNDTFKVDVNQPSGCNFHMRYVPASIQPGFTSVVQCNNVTFTDNTTVSPASTTVTSWNWSFPGGTPATATTQTALVTYPAAGSYVATLTVTCSAGCFDVITHTVTVAGPPVAAFSNVPVCIGSPTPFTDNSTAQPGDPIATYSWSFPGGNPATSTAQNPTSTYPAGTYTATLTVTSQQGCTGVTSQTVAINPQPAAVFNGTNVCLNGSNVFTDHSVGNNTISNWNWSFDDGSTSNSQNPSHPFATYGTHTATLIVTNNFGCKDTTTKTVVVNPLPTANFSSTPVCFGACTPFTDLSTIPTGAITGWAWSFGDPASGANNTSAIQAPCHTFSASGPFNISLTVTSDSSCTNTVTLPATVIPLPVSAFSSTTVCVGNATSFTDNSVPGTGDPISSWSWSLTGGNPATSTLQNPNSTFPAGSYSATLTLTSQHGCTATVTQPLTVNPRPAASFTGTNVCLNNITTFTDQSVGNNSVSSWSWNFADPGSGTKDTSSFQNPTHTYASTGAFTTTLIITNNFGCKDTTTKTVIVNPLPVVNFSYVPVCYGDSTCFKDLSTISTGSIAGWNWNFGDLASGAANISNLKNPCHVFSGLGPYSVLLTVTSDSTCQSTTVLTATVIPHPVAAITPQNACLHFPAGFTDNSSSQGGDPITSWDWNFGDGTPDVGIQNPTHNYAAPGTYTTTLIVVSSKGCKDTVTKPVTIYNNPVAAFTTPKSGCSPVSQTFADVSTSQDGTIVSWLWDFQGGSPAIGATANSSSTWSNAGSYGVQLIVTTSFGCKDTLFIPNYINVYSWPNAGFTVAPAQNSVITPDFSFANLWSNDVTHWVWNFGDNTTDSTSLTPVHSYSATATNNDYYTYPICLYVQNIHGCWDSICHNVELEPEFEFYIPNSFTPNGDNINDVFYGKSRGVKDYNIWLFDRWGNLIWDCHWTGKNTDWDNRGQEG